MAGMARGGVGGIFQGRYPESQGGMRIMADLW